VRIVFTATILLYLGVIYGTVDCQSARQNCLFEAEKACKKYEGMDYHKTCFLQQFDTCKRRNGCK